MFTPKKFSQESRKESASEEERGTRDNRENRGNRGKREGGELEPEREQERE